MDTDRIALFCDTALAAGSSAPRPGSSTPAAQTPTAATGAAS